MFRLYPSLLGRGPAKRYGARSVPAKRRRGHPICLTPSRAALRGSVGSECRHGCEVGSFKGDPESSHLNLISSYQRRPAVWMTLCSGVPGAKKRRGPAFSPLIAVPVALARRPVLAQPPTNRRTPPQQVPETSASSSSSSAAPRLVQTTSYTVRGTLPSAALTDADRNELLQALEADTVAQSTAAARASAVRTWSLFHLRWYGLASPVTPVTCDSMRAVAAQMKSSGYRSFPNYVTALKALHKKEFSWGGDLDDCRRECEASTQGHRPLSPVA